MTTPAKKPAAPSAAATKTTTRTAAAKAPVARTAAKTPAKSVAPKVVEAPAPQYNFTKPYKMLTGLDDSEFCSKVSAHLNAGYTLVGGAAITVVGGKPFVAQAVFKASNIEKPKAKGKGKGKKK